MRAPLGAHQSGFRGFNPPESAPQQAGLRVSLGSTPQSRLSWPRSLGPTPWLPLVTPLHPHLESCLENVDLAVSGQCRPKKESRWQKVIYRAPPTREVIGSDSALPRTGLWTGRGPRLFTDHALWTLRTWTWSIPFKIVLRFVDQRQRFLRMSLVCGKLPRRNRPKQTRDCNGIEPQTPRPARP